jgi:hypothetical protein
VDHQPAHAGAAGHRAQSARPGDPGDPRPQLRTTTAHAGRQRTPGPAWTPVDGPGGHLGKSAASQRRPMISPRSLIVLRNAGRYA